MYNFKVNYQMLFHTNYKIGMHMPCSDDLEVFLDKKQDVGPLQCFISGSLKLKS